MPTLKYSLTRVKSLLGGDAYNWIRQVFPQIIRDGSGLPIGLQDNDGNVIAAGGSGGSIVPFSSRALTNLDNNCTLVPSDSSQTATINIGLPTNFGCFFNKNATVTAGAGVTVTDKRTGGATNPSFAVVAVGTETYDLIGSKT